MAEWKPSDPDAWKGGSSDYPSFPDNPEADNEQAGYDSADDIIMEVIKEDGLKNAVLRFAHSVNFMIANEVGMKQAMGAGYSPFVHGRIKYFTEFVNRHINEIDFKHKKDAKNRKNEKKENN